MVQKNPNCGQLFKGPNGGFHMCMKPRGHKGVCGCSHYDVVKGTELYRSSKNGHEQTGVAGDADNPL